MTTPRLSILIVGDKKAAETAKCSIEDGADPDVRILSRGTIEDGLALLSSEADIALVLLLWRGDNPKQLPDLVWSMLVRQGNSMMAVMVRSRTELPEDVSAALWDLGVADRSFSQPLDSVDLSDSVAVAMRNYRRQTHAN